MVSLAIIAVSITLTKELIKFFYIIDPKSNIPYQITIYQNFKNNKILLLFLLQNQIITTMIYDEITTKIESNGNRFCHFFYPELENFI